MSSLTTVSLLDTPFPDRDKVVEQSRELTPVWNKSLSDLYRVTYKAQRDLTMVTGDPLRFDFSSLDFWAQAAGPGGGFVTGAPFCNMGVSELNHPGIARFFTDVNNGDITSTWIGQGEGTGPMTWQNLDFARFVFKTPPTISSARFEIGLSSNAEAGWIATTFEAGNEMIYLFYDTAVDGALHFRLRVGGVTTQDVTIAASCPMDTWVDVIFQRRRPTGSTAYVLDVIANGKIYATFSTGLPSDTTQYGGMCRIGTRTGAAREISFDYVDIRPLVVSLRYTATL